MDAEKLNYRYFVAYVYYRVKNIVIPRLSGTRRHPNKINDFVC